MYEMRVVEVLPGGRGIINMITLEPQQVEARRRELERKLEIGEISEWEYRYLIQGLQACMTGGTFEQEGYDERNQRAIT